jgi:hypothetical protein
VKRGEGGGLGGREERREEESGKLKVILAALISFTFVFGSFDMHSLAHGIHNSV